MRECEGKELERRPRRAGVIRGLEQAREREWPSRSQQSASAGSEVLKAPVVGPPSMASPLGADDAQGASSLPCIGCEEGTGLMVKPLAAPLSINYMDAKRPELQALEAPR